MRREGRRPSSAMAGAVGGSRSMGRQTGVAPKPVRTQPEPRLQRETRRAHSSRPMNDRPPRHNDRGRRNYGRPTPPPPPPHNGYAQPPRRGGRRRGSCFSYFAALIVMLVIVLLVYFGDDLKEKFFGNEDVTTSGEVLEDEE